MILSNTTSSAEQCIWSFCSPPTSADSAQPRQPTQARVFVLRRGACSDASVMHTCYLAAGGGPPACGARHQRGMGWRGGSVRWSTPPLQTGTAQQVTAGEAVHGQRGRGVQGERSGTSRTLLLIWEQRWKLTGSADVVEEEISFRKYTIAAASMDWRELSYNV